MRTISFDTETKPIGPGAVAPEIILGTFAHRVGGDVATDLYTHADGLRAHVEDALRQAVAGAWTVITHNGGFDYACVCATWPDLIPLVFDALESGNLRDTLWDEKLLNLSTTGRLDAVPLPDGSTMQLEYNLATLERKYLGRDRSSQKDETLSDENWRTNYEALEGWTAYEIQAHAPDAYRYACEDAEGTLLVHEAQLARLEEFRYASTATGPFQLYKSFCLYLETAWGMAVDRERVAAVRRAVEAELRGNCDLLRASGILTPALGPRPYEKQRERAVEYLHDMGIEPVTETEFFEDFDWTPYVDRLRELGIKFKAPVEEKVCTAELQRVAGEAYRRLGAIPTMTAGRTDKQGVAHPQIKLGDEETEFLAAHCPIMRQYYVRKSLAKLVTNQLPILESAPVIHFKYNALVETTRTSSSGNPRGKPALYPAANGQQIPKSIEGGNVKVDPRRCYRPRPGTVFFDVDLHCLELACVGQVTHDLFGESVHLDRYNAGYDLHAYLASQILVRAQLEAGPARDVQDTLAGGFSTPEEQYQTFLQFKKCGDAALEKVYKDYRNLAKPIGLGFPGGIGPAKMVTLARTAYNVEITEEKAHELREMWRDVYPEMPRYFDWVGQQRDHYNDGPLDEDGHSTQLYWYTTPMGAIRRGCTFCSEANGAAMQSPGAEAATAGNNAVVRACYDPTRGSVLYGARPIAFVHDQIIGETTRDAATWHEQCMAVSALMIEAAKVALPKVRMRTEPLLTTVWTKSAEPTFDGSGRLIPWTETKR